MISPSRTSTLSPLSRRAISTSWANVDLPAPESPVNQIVNPFLDQNFNISLSTAGFFTTVWGIGVVLGSVAGGALINKVGNRTSVLISMAIAFVSIISLAVITKLAIAWFLVALFGICYGTYQTVYFALAMEYTDPRIAATMFSILMAVTNIGQGIGLGLTGFFADSFGFQITFFIMAMLNLLALPFLPMIFGKRRKKLVSA